MIVGMTPLIVMSNVFLSIEFGINHYMPASTCFLFVDLNIEIYLLRYLIGCFTWFCPCITFGQIAEIVDGGTICKSTNKNLLLGDVFLSKIIICMILIYQNILIVILNFARRRRTVMPELHRILLNSSFKWTLKNKNINIIH